MRQRWIVIVIVVAALFSCTQNKDEQKYIVDKSLFPKRSFELIKPIKEYKNDIQQRIEYNNQQEFLRQERLLQDKKIREQQERIAREKNENKSYEDPFYQHIQLISNPATIDVLVNKQNQLPSDYVPNNLVLSTMYQLDNRKHYLRDVAYYALSEMILSAKETHGYIIVIVSAYRSYNTQATIYQNYVSRNGQTSADTYSARAGHSEHQTGLAVDLSSAEIGGISHQFGNTEEGKWLSQNAHHFGYILRYPQNKTHITGYIHEPWHFRFVGKELAAKIYECNCTYEEFLAQ